MIDRCQSGGSRIISTPGDSGRSPHAPCVVIFAKFCGDKVSLCGWGCGGVAGGCGVHATLGTWGLSLLCGQRFWGHPDPFQTHLPRLGVKVGLAGAWQWLPWHFWVHTCERQGRKVSQAPTPDPAVICLEERSETTSAGSAPSGLTLPSLLARGVVQLPTGGGSVLAPAPAGVARSSRTTPSSALGQDPSPSIQGDRGVLWCTKERAVGP